ncbi:MAG: nucleotidyltransferase domain-containing protein [Caldilineae bacterium]|nr:MAG: nucleotidyltransferase domain-containing protein [Caldilineae bacterium]
MPFDTSLRDAALARRRAELERMRKTLLKETQRALESLGPRYGIRRAYIFGSLVAPGRFGPLSDVDIAVEQIDPRQLTEAIGEFSMQLGRRVDLIELEKCHFAHRIREKGLLWTPAN